MAGGKRAARRRALTKRQRDAYEAALVAPAAPRGPQECRLCGAEFEDRADCPECSEPVE